ncbi:hypothetical protein J6590_108065, partial [Homalodisca vitripennis]
EQCILRVPPALKGVKTQQPFYFVKRDKPKGKSQSTPNKPQESVLDILHLLHKAHLVGCPHHATVLKDGSDVGTIQHLQSPQVSHKSGGSTQQPQQS